MAAWSLKRFSNPGVLRQIHFPHLLRFLKRHERTLIKRGVVIPSSGDSKSFNFPALIRVFLTPEQGLSKELIDALYFIDELATEQGMDALLNETECQDLELDQESTPADIAVQIWLHDPKILERKHAENAFNRIRSF